ncbi:MAG: hypothetical protein HY706_13175, partial [Candidatus Hydrogenedentes bacterium]|nr:hypothetical protein [Candidatus Hydrogenedentota bacterium]
MDKIKVIHDRVGQTLTVWGFVSNDPSIYMRPTISVSSAHGEGDPVIALYVPEYPCDGSEPTDPPITEPYPYPYLGIDLLPGEIAAIGDLVKEDDALYLETPSGRILLNGDVTVPWDTTLQSDPSLDTPTDAGEGT